MLKTIGSRLLLSVLGLCLAFSSPALAEKPGGGGGTTLPPVRYQVQFWTVLGANYLGDISDTNDSGLTVGEFEVDLNGDGVTDRKRGYLYDPMKNQDWGVDLNSIVSGIDPGWAIRHARAINNFGQIAATIEPINSPNTLFQAVMIDMNQDPPVLYKLPDDWFSSHSIAADINDWGDIAVRYRRDNGTWGHYVYNFDPLFGITEPLDLGITVAYDTGLFINNNRDVIGQNGNGDAYRSRWNGSTEIVPAARPTGINEGGAFCGTVKVPLKGRKTTDRAFVYNTSLEISSDSYPAQDLNESLDYIVYNKLYHRTYGVLNVVDLLDPNDPGGAIIKSGLSLTLQTVIERDVATNFPVLSGSAGGMGVTLLPVAAR